MRQETATAFCRPCRQTADLSTAEKPHAPQGWLLASGEVDDERLVVLAAPAELREFTSWAVGREEVGEVRNG